MASRPLRWRTCVFAIQPWSRPGPTDRRAEGPERLGSSISPRWAHQSLSPRYEHKLGDTVAKTTRREHRLRRCVYLLEKVDTKISPTSQKLWNS